MNIFKSPDFINTSNSYSGELMQIDEMLVVPYINLFFHDNNPINSLECCIDYSYLIFNKPYSIEFPNNIKIKNTWGDKIPSELIEEYIMITGSHSSFDIKIESESLCLVLPLDYKMSPNRLEFIPIDTPNYKANMNKEQTSVFLYDYYVTKKYLQSVLGGVFEQSCV